MASRASPDIDDELFDEVYGKAYTGPPRLVNNNVSDKERVDKRPMSSDQSDDDDERKDPNAVPTDFTSREARVWEAKAKATERNWKKRKEEEMICKICGEAGHFTQGCPTTLGANRKSADFFERVPARDPRVRSLFTEKVIHQMEKDIGCKIKMDEKFLFVSGKDRIILSKGVDAVHKLIREGDTEKGKDSSSSHRSRSRSPSETAASQQRRPELQRSHSSQRNATQLEHKSFRQEKVIEDHLRDDLQTISRGSPQAYNSEGGKRRTMHSRSPQKPTISRDRYSSYHGQGRTGDMPISGRRNGEKQELDIHSGRKFPSYPQTLEELEMKFKKETMELEKVHDKEEDEENYRHRECIRDIRENYLKKLAVMRDMHAKEWQKFLHFDIQKRQQQAYNTAYNQPGYFNHDQSAGNPEYSGAGIPVDSHSTFHYGGNNYPVSGHPEVYGELQRPKHGDFNKAYGQF